MDVKLDLIAAASGAARPAAGRPAGPTGADFGAALRAALDGVNAAQNDAEARAREFQLGAEGASLEETMIAIAKANVAFQTAVQVRNRLVAAYHEIMNMQV